MADSQENFQSYRVVWKISEELDLNAFLRSQKFKIGDSEWFLEMCIQPCYRFSLCGSFEDRREILRTSYYLLSNGINIKLDAVNKFLTNFFNHGISTGEKILVCAIDIKCEASSQNSEHWLEGTSDRTSGKYEHANMFKKMTYDRISEIAKIIENSFSDSLVSKKAEKSHRLKPSHHIRKPHWYDETLSPKKEMTVIAVHPSPAHNLLLSSVQCFNEQNFCDITIQVSPGGHDIRAHKLVLFSGSTVWKQLLINDEKLSIINVPDLDPETVKALVTYIYDGSVPKPSKDTVQLLIAAATYGVDGLKKWCEQQLIATITIEAVINMMILAHRYNAPTLFEKTISVVRQNIAVLKQRAEWKSLFFSYPELAIEMVNSLY